MATLSSLTPRRRAAHLGPQRRRPQVLDAALAITVEHGVSEVTIGAVATRLNVTRPAVYACFPGRVQLITALLDRDTEMLSDALVAALDSARGQRPEDAFIDGYQSLLRVVEERPQSWPFVFFAAPDRAVAGRFVRMRAQLAAATSAQLRPALPRPQRRLTTTHEKRREITDDRHTHTAATRHRETRRCTDTAGKDRYPASGHAA